MRHVVNAKGDATGLPYDRHRRSGRARHLSDDLARPVLTFASTSSHPFGVHAAGSASAHQQEGTV
ncbi:hypothetical protein FJZ36_06175 [Candidatus Poribacteria bacterium]|nr:hypothetical protein [Candidatus Poribacteria bacterium]